MHDGLGLGRRSRGEEHHRGITRRRGVARAQRPDRIGRHGPESSIVECSARDGPTVGNEGDPTDHVACGRAFRGRAVDSEPRQSRFVVVLEESRRVDEPPDPGVVEVEGKLGLRRHRVQADGGRPDRGDAKDRGEELRPVGQKHADRLPRPDPEAAQSVGDPCRLPG